jgi:hypothetical protein
MFQTGFWGDFLRADASRGRRFVRQERLGSLIPCLGLGNRG